MFLKFKYNFWKDLFWMYKTYISMKELKRKDILVFKPSIKNWIRLWFKKPEGKINISVRYPITCYWISSGTWGAFTPPNTIYICPWKKDGGMYSVNELKRVIFHELFHLYYYEETKTLTFKEREDYINRKMREEINPSS